MQSPLISLPRKTTTPADFSTPLRHAIAHTYGERPDTYNEEIATLTRCRADAVTDAAGSETTARDLLFKYFGQLELLELRFATTKVTFDWTDAFTGKQTQQTSLAFEKASVLHLVASHLSSLAAQQPRLGNPDGIKRAYAAARQSAGLLIFIHENFLHAPSTDLSRELLTFCSKLETIQAGEIFWDKCVGEHKPASLLSRMAQSLAGGYTSLVQDSIPFQGKGILDRAWINVITIKGKYFSSLAAWYRATADHNRGEYGAATSRWGLAVTLASEAHKLAKEFTYSFIPSINSAAADLATVPVSSFYAVPLPTSTGPPPTLPADAATALLEITKTHLTAAQESHTTAERDNDLIYHALPIAATLLPTIEPLPLSSLATPTTIQEIYAQPSISALIGPDIFRRLVPLEVHEQASVYSEEKAKLVRREVESCERVEEEVGLAWSEMDPRARVEKYRRALGSQREVDGEVPVEVQGLAEKVTQRERQAGQPIDALVQSLDERRRACESAIQSIKTELDDESRECERMRVKYGHKWTQQPSATFTRALRGDLNAHEESLRRAAENDRSIVTLWRTVQPDIATLLQGPRSSALTSAFGDDSREGKAGKAPVNLLDLDDDLPSAGGGGVLGKEEEEVGVLVDEVEANMKRLEAVRAEQKEVLNDLKQKVQADDVSHLLLLNRRNTDASPTLFATELEKFKPYQARLSAACQAQRDVVDDVAKLCAKVEALPGFRKLLAEKDGRGRRTEGLVARFRDAVAGYEDVRVGVEKGLDFYNSITTLLGALRRDVRAFVSSRAQERNRLVTEAETRDRLSSPGSVSPPPLPGHPQRSLEEQLAGLRVAPPQSSPSTGGYRGYSSPPPPQSQGQAWNQPPPMSSPYSPPPIPSAPGSRLPPPPTQGARATAPNPYDFSSFGSSSAGLSNAFAAPRYPSTGSASGQGSAPGAYGMDNGYSVGMRYTSPPPAMPPSMLPLPPPRPQYSSYPSANGGSPYPPPSPVTRPAYPPGPTAYANYLPPSAPAPLGQPQNGNNGYSYR
ncbi:hypothetical protein QFC22_002323 [Naganishia vaughanmartiniae]|uniref:Uncharacterized protein n=1 Tax=Naganishia vaughanmartiniae TaxID=1424756 RepID=A0ACC2XCE6_9TREE|nr:hypothetical protein QFC22_002323 [Naganishia vaughanmartiniae]